MQRMDLTERQSQKQGKVAADYDATNLPYSVRNFLPLMLVPPDFGGPNS